MTCDVQLQLTEVRCAVASCDVCVKSLEPILVVTCDVRACGAFYGLHSATTILHIILALMKDFLVSIMIL